MQDFIAIQPALETGLLFAVAAAGEMLRRSGLALRLSLKSTAGPAVWRNSDCEGEMREDVVAYQNRPSESVIAIPLGRANATRIARAGVQLSSI